MQEHHVSSRQVRASETRRCCEALSRLLYSARLHALLHVIVYSKALFRTVCGTSLLHVCVCVCVCSALDGVCVCVCVCVCVLCVFTRGAKRFDSTPILYKYRNNFHQCLHSEKKGTLSCLSTARTLFGLPLSSLLPCDARAHTLVSTRTCNFVKFCLPRNKSLYSRACAEEDLSSS
jgi:hypothetical protein